MVLVLYKAEIFSSQGRERFAEGINQANIYFFILSFLIGLTVHFSSTVKWYMLLRAHSMIVSFGRVFAYYMIGQFYNLLLPTSVGGDVVRAYELGRYTGRKADALASVFVERYTGILVLLVLSAVAVIVNLNIFNIPLITVSLTIFTFGLGGLGWIVIDRRPFEWLRSITSGRIKLGAVFAKIEKMQDAVNKYKKNKNALLWAFINSFIFYFLAVLNIYITARVFSIQVDFKAIVIATPIIMLIMNIPISIGNLGLMEFAYVFTFDILGYGPALGLSTVLLMRLKSIVDGAAGGLLHPFFAAPRDHAMSDQDRFTER